MSAHPRAPELKPEFAWLNTDRPLTFSNELKGQVVLLDFWTYCCINCMHVLPDLAYLEAKYAREPFVVIGVHSAKFENEGSRQTIRAAIGRYEIHHPVVVDEGMSLWSEYTVRSWPTLVLVGADGRVIGAVAGEGNRAALDEAIGKALADAKAAGIAAPGPLRIEREESVRAASGLAFPGKVLADRAGGRLYIADSNHSRIVVTTLPDASGRSRLVATVGSGRVGRDDGPAGDAAFHHPQGLALLGETLLVADTENHLIRAVDTERFDVRTVAGTGEQSYDRSGGKRGTAQGLNSPWDLAVEGSTCYIAMAGPHQIWRLDLPMGLCRAWAGSGRENLVDGPAESAALAQPSGLALLGNHLYFADSEVSAVRRIDLASEQVETLVGRGLFDFGDVDGDAKRARLQHPLGVTTSGSKILVADTYNHKIKELDPETRTIRTLHGDGRPGTDRGDALALFEPGGLHAADGVLYVADTNNHRVVRVDLATGAWREVTIEGLEAPMSTEAESRGEAAGLPGAIAAGPTRLLANRATQWSLAVELPAGAHASEEAPASVRVSRGGDVLLQRTLLGAAWPLAFELPAQPQGAADLRVQVSFAYCHEGQGVCVPASPAWNVPVRFEDQGDAVAVLTAALA
ncbi:MAG TPA: thioredoxin-like domain-containing protein [Candidatus Eisenbacteria bacterium]|nr:thioredoxin-like domain-containing protein [Candidatus Eisenbacteria bacterium]